MTRPYLAEMGDIAVALTICAFVAVGLFFAWQRIHDRSRRDMPTQFEGWRWWACIT